MAEAPGRKAISPRFLLSHKSQFRENEITFKVLSLLKNTRRETCSPFITRWI